MCITAETMLDGAPDAVKVACPVLAGGKAGDNIKGLPIGTAGLYPQRGRHSEICQYPNSKHQRRGQGGRPVLDEIRNAFILRSYRLYHLRGPGRG